MPARSATRPYRAVFRPFVAVLCRFVVGYMPFMASFSVFFAFFLPFLGGPFSSKQGAHALHKRTCAFSYKAAKAIEAQDIVVTMMRPSSPTTASAQDKAAQTPSPTPRAATPVPAHAVASGNSPAAGADATVQAVNAAGQLLAGGVAAWFAAVLFGIAH